MKHTLYIIDERGERNTVHYTPLEHFNLMELVEDQLWEEWGDCKGRAMCGTCQVEVIKGTRGVPEPFEQQTLDNLPNCTPRSRLACQILTDNSIHNMTFKILKDY